MLDLDHEDLTGNNHYDYMEKLFASLEAPMPELQMEKENFHYQVNNIRDGSIWNTGDTSIIASISEGINHTMLLI